MRRLRVALNSLRAQLLLWIALPVAVSLLAISLLEIRGHEQAMEQMVQQQAELLATSIAALLDAHIDRNQSILLQAVDGWTADRTFAENASATFPAGLAVYEGGQLLGQPPDTMWPTLPSVQSLVGQVARQHISGVVTVENQDGSGWLLIQAVPGLKSDRPMVLVGAVPVEDLTVDDTFAALHPAVDTEVRVTDGTGRTLALWNQLGDGMATTGKVVTAQSVVAPTAWQVRVSEEWSDLVPPLLHFSNAVLVIVGTAVVISLLSAYFGLRNIVQPLQKLDVAASEVGWGNFAAIQQPVGGVAEIEELRVALARMAEQVRLYQQELQSYIGAMTRGQEDERRRLARELHDETVQDLIALSHQVELAERDVSHDPEKAAVRLRELRPLLSSTMGGLRRQIHNLRPLYLEDLGFVPALEMLVRQVTQRHSLVGDFEVLGEPERRLDSAVEISAFRIVQEALQNVVMHAQAEWVHVELNFLEEGITLRIEDNGRGFDAPSHPYQLAQQGHYGLLGMRERTQLHGGTLRIESQVGRGTTVTAWLPEQNTGTTLDKSEATTDGYT